MKMQMAEGKHQKYQSCHLPFITDDHPIQTHTGPDMESKHKASCSFKWKEGLTGCCQRAEGLWTHLVWSAWPWRWKIVHRPICTEHLLARRAMLMNRFPSLCLHISLSPFRARHMEDCGRESSASAKRQCKSDKCSAGNLQLSSRTLTQSVYMNPLLLASKSNNSHPTLTEKLLLTLLGPSLVHSPSYL